MRDPPPVGEFPDESRAAGKRLPSVHGLPAIAAIRRSYAFSDIIRVRPSS
jgi:hypothetical protein